MGSLVASGLHLLLMPTPAFLCLTLNSSLSSLEPVRFLYCFSSFQWLLLLMAKRPNSGHLKWSGEDRMWRVVAVEGWGGEQDV